MPKAEKPKTVFPLKKMRFALFTPEGEPHSASASAEAAISSYASHIRGLIVEDDDYLRYYAALIKAGWSICRIEASLTVVAKLSADHFSRKGH